MKQYILTVWFCLAVTVFHPLWAQAALFGEFGLESEMKMGRQYEVMIKSMMPLVEDPEIKQYVQGIVNRIVATLPPQPYKFQTNVLLHNTMNAFAMPGGYVYVHTGLIQHLEHESQLAGVLAHEVAHVTQRHIARRIERGQVISVASVLGAVLGIVAGGNESGSAMVAGSMAAGQAASLNYSRGDETDADQFGLQYLVAAGYNPNGLGGAFAKIQEQGRSRGNYPEYLSTHPGASTRMSTLASRIQTMPSEVRNRPEQDTQFFRVQTLIWARYGDAQYAAQVFASRSSSDPMTHLGKAILAARQNRVVEAEASFKEALRLSPVDPLILREAGAFHYHKGDASLARQQLERSLQLDGADYLTRFYHARLLDDLGEATRAQEEYRRVLRDVPDDPEVHSYYGRSLGQSGREFEGFIHLAYAALYSNDERRIGSWLDQARRRAQTPEQEAEIKRFEEQRGERMRILDQR